MRVDYIDESRLSIGQRYHMDDLKKIYDDGGFFRGINTRTDDSGEIEFIVLTSSGDSHYSDDLHGERFRYIGEDYGDGDQRKTAGNGRLIAQCEELTVPIYFFSRNKKGEDWEYEGLVDVVDHEYISEGGRMINRFLLEKLEVTSTQEYEEVEADVEDESSNPPLKEDEEQEAKIGKRKVRSSLFRRRVKQYYDETCAICGSNRKSPEGNPEVEAAHIYPRRENGRDHYRNGLALCRLHHWAFDNGWISVSDDFEVLVQDQSDRKEPEEFADLRGNTLVLPDNENHWPLPKYLRKHREIHQID
ncbi:HNH endonuclease [Haloarchaeobius sp. TZWWS8]|uniref:HNH endonuclease n=1 Tax=Haloarchaeobius sp. TZWWS8 TaxID=3446121 RepID=UPI003EBA9D83